MGFIYPEKEKRNKEQNLKVRVLSKALKSSGSDSPVCFFFLVVLGFSKRAKQPGTLLKPLT